MFVILSSLSFIIIIRCVNPIELRVIRIYKKTIRKVLYRNTLYIDCGLIFLKRLTIRNGEIYIEMQYEWVYKCFALSVTKIKHQNLIP